MIRERRDEDIEPLCALLTKMQYPAGHTDDAALEEWLQGHDVELSWVFDMAPVTVAPTQNVVGHVQLFRPGTVSQVAAQVGRPAEELLAIGRFFVDPEKHAYGVGRYLLKESVKHIQALGRHPVLERATSLPPADNFFERFGFEDVPSEGLGPTMMSYVRQ